MLAVHRSMQLFQVFQVFYFLFQHIAILSYYYFCHFEIFQQISQIIITYISCMLDWTPLRFRSLFNVYVSGVVCVYVWFWFLCLCSSLTHQNYGQNNNTMTPMIYSYGKDKTIKWEMLWCLGEKLPRKKKYMKNIWISSTHSRNFVEGKIKRQTDTK